MSCLYLKKYNSYFIHIPKTGGTSVEFFFIRDLGIPIKLGQGHVQIYKDLHQEHHMGRDKKNFPIHHWNVREAEEYLNQVNYSFSIVRDPVERFKSECKFRAITPDKLIAERSYRTMSQYDYLYTNGVCKVTDVFRFEELKKLEEKLSQLFEMSVVLPHEQKSPQGRQVKLSEGEISYIKEKYKIDYETFY